MNLTSKLLQRVKAALSVAPVSHSGTTAQTGDAIDRNGFDSMIVLLSNAAASGSPDTAAITLSFTHCDTLGGSYTAVTLKAAASAQNCAAKGCVAYHVDLAGFKRYVKCVTTPAFTGGSTPAIVAGASAILGDAASEPPESKTILAAA